MSARPDRSVPPFRAARVAIALAIAACVLLPAPAVAHEGWGIARDRLGRVYLADIPANTVWRLAPDGRLEPVLRGVHTHALTSGADGRIYGTHVAGESRSVWAFDADGRTVTVLPATTTLPLDLQRFALGSDGAMYSGTPYQWAVPDAERTVYLVRRRADGTVDTLAGGPAGRVDGRVREARLRNVVGMAWGARDRLLFTDGPYLRQWHADGRVETIAGPLTVTRWGQDLLGVAVAPDSSVVVADFSGRTVQRVRRALVDTLLRGGWYWSPTGVLAAPEGVYVLEHPRAPLGVLGDLRIGPYLRLRLVRSDGTSTVLARRYGDRTVIAAGAVIALVGMVRGVGRLVRGRSTSRLAA